MRVGCTEEEQKGVRDRESEKRQEEVHKTEENRSVYGRS